MTANCFSVCRAHTDAGAGNSAALEQRVFNLFCNSAVMLSELRVWAEATVAAKLRVKFLNICFKHKSDSISSRQKPYPFPNPRGARVDSCFI